MTAYGVSDPDAAGRCFFADMVRILSFFAVALTLVTIALGTYVRAADSGLGCPDWPGCFGRPFALWELAMAPRYGVGATVDVAKIRLDITTHRYLAGAVGICILVLSTLVWTLKRNRIRATFLVLTSMSMVIMQALLGMWALEYKLLPVAVAGHLLLGFAILLLLFLLGLAATPERPRPMSMGVGLRVTGWLGLWLVLSQIVAGGWASANYAGLACPDFPGCLGQAWPDVDFRGGFSPWRMQRLDFAEAMLSLPARAAIHWVHRVGGLSAYLVLTLLAVLLAARRDSGKLRKAGIGLGALALMQAGLGVALILMRMPILIEVAHSVMAGLLLLGVTYVFVLLAYCPRTAPATR